MIPSLYSNPVQQQAAPAPPSFELTTLAAPVQDRGEASGNTDTLETAPAPSSRFSQRALLNTHHALRTAGMAIAAIGAEQASPGAALGKPYMGMAGGGTLAVIGGGLSQVGAAMALYKAGRCIPATPPHGKSSTYNQVLSNIYAGVGTVFAVVLGTHWGRAVEHEANDGGMSKSDKLNVSLNTTTTVIWLVCTVLYAELAGRDARRARASANPNANG